SGRAPAYNDGVESDCSNIQQLRRMAGQLERIFQGKLNLPIVRRRACNACAPGHIHSVAGQAKVGVVQGVKELGPELNLVSFMYLKVFLQSEIHVDKPWAAQVANSRVTEDVGDLLAGGQWRRDEYRRVEPARQRLVTGVAPKIRLVRLING